MLKKLMLEFTMYADFKGYFIANTSKKIYN